MNLLASPQIPVKSSSRKKVVVRRFNRDWIPGYLAPTRFVLGSGAEARIEMLDLAGRVLAVGLSEVKMVSFVRDFHANDPQPERLLRKTFLARPRANGVWVRLTFRDNDQLEGIAANDLSLIEDEGLLLTPPDTRSNTQRIYVPRMALAELQVLGVIGAPRRGPLAPSTSQQAVQTDLFSVDLPANSRPN